MMFFISKRQLYKKGFCKTWDLITLENKAFNANSISLLFSVLAFICYFSITIGDILNVSGRSDFAGYANGTVLVYMVGTSAFTSICSLLLVRVFMAISKATTSDDTSLSLKIVTVLGRFSAFYSLASPIIYIRKCAIVIYLCY
eukprot:Pgem_evm1s3861